MYLFVPAVNLAMINPKSLDKRIREFKSVLDANERVIRTEIELERYWTCWYVASKSLQTFKSFYQTVSYFEGEEYAHLHLGKYLLRWTKLENELNKLVSHDDKS